MRQAEAEALFAEQLKDEEKKARVERERQKLIAEYAHLKDYFPKGVLAKFEDFALVE